MSAGARVFEYLECRPTMRLLGGMKIDKNELKGDIKFENVKFSYPARPDQVVIHDLNLDIEAGKTVALCGSSGSGTIGVSPSTLVFVGVRIVENPLARIEYICTSTRLCSTF